MKLDLIKDQRGGNPTLAAVLLIGGFMVFFFMYVFLAGPLRDIWSTVDNAAPPNMPAGITSKLNTVLLIIPVAVIIALVIWYYAKISSTEYEGERL